MTSKEKDARIAKVILESMTDIQKEEILEMIAYWKKVGNRVREENEEDGYRIIPVVTFSFSHRIKGCRLSQLPLERQESVRKRLGKIPRNKPSQ